MSKEPTVFHPVGAEVTDKWVAMSVMSLPGAKLPHAYRNLNNRAPRTIGTELVGAQTNRQLITHPASKRSIGSLSQGVSHNRGARIHEGDCTINLECG